MTLKTNLSRLLHGFARGEDGAAAVVAGLLLPVIVGSLALVEAGKVYGVKNQLQATADAAAMASVHKVPSLGDVQLRALDFAHRNMPADGQYGDVLTNEGVEVGNWDTARAEDLRFDPGATPANAVRVTTRGVMPLFFASALRAVNVDVPESFTPAARAIALLRQDQCYSNGFVAGGRVDMNSSNNFGGNFCVYGLQGVTMNSSNEFAPGTEVGMANLADLIAGDNNPGLPEALAEKVVAPPAANAAQLMIDDLLAGNGPMGMPVLIPSWPPIGGITPGTLYRVAAAVEIKLSGGMLQDVGIISDVAINVKSNSNLSGVTLASPGAVSIDSNVVFGDANFCTTGVGQSIILSGGSVTGNEPPLGTNSNIDLYGVQMISDGTIVMNSNLRILGASIQSSGDIVFNSQFDVAGCPEGTTPSPIHGETLVSQLVD